MKLHFITYLTVVCFIFWSVACKPSTENPSPQDTFGNGIDTTEVQSVESATTMIASKDSIDHIVIKGKISEVCQAKGCWINVVSPSDSTAKAIFVEFKDYAFVLPKDIAGASVVIQGKMYRDVTSVDELKQNAEDEGLTPADIAKITEPLEELSFMADGVRIIR